MSDQPGGPPDRDSRGGLHFEASGRTCRIAIVVIVALLFLVGITVSLLDLGSPA